MRDEIAEYMVDDLRYWGSLVFVFPNEYSCKKLEKENCNVHIDSDTCYSKDLMRGL